MQIRTASGRGPLQQHQVARSPAATGSFFHAVWLPDLDTSGSRFNSAQQSRPNAGFAGRGSGSNFGSASASGSGSASSSAMKPQDLRAELASLLPKSYARELIAVIQ